jgi:hypothetical protein
MATSFTTMRPFWSSPSDAIRSLAGNPGRRCAAFQENAGTIPRGVRACNAAEDFAVMRHLSLNLLKSVKNSKLSIKLRRMSAAWNQEFLMRVLTAYPDVE